MTGTNTGTILLAHYVNEQNKNAPNGAKLKVASFGEATVFVGTNSAASLYIRNHLYYYLCHDSSIYPVKRK